MVSNSQKTIGSKELNPGNTTLIRCLYLLGLFAQHARIDKNAKIFNEAFGAAKNVSVTALIAKSLAAFTKPVVPESLRKIAIASYGTLTFEYSDSRILMSRESKFLQDGNARCEADYHVLPARWLFDT